MEKEILWFYKFRHIFNKNIDEATAFILIKWGSPHNEISILIIHHPVNIENSQLETPQCSTGSLKGQLSISLFPRKKGTVLTVQPIISIVMNHLLVDLHCLVVSEASHALFCFAIFSETL